MTLVADALAALDVDAVLLGLPDRSFPSDAAENTGAGAPLSAAGRRCLSWVRSMGFTGIQLTPQGEVPRGHWSPYDGSAFSRGRLGLAVAALATPEWAGILDDATVARLVAACPAGAPERAALAYAADAHARALATAHRRLVTCRAAGDAAAEALGRRLDAFVAAAAGWCPTDGLYEALSAVHDGAGWSAWPEAHARHAAGHAAFLAEYAEPIAAHAFAQFVLHEQHQSLRAAARGLGLEVWGDLPVGIADRDAWAWQDALLPGYRLGAPPSRTNPDGQPWGYPVLDPARPAARARFVRARLEKLFGEYDGIRIDHPHGHVCPWVYRTGTAEEGAAVRAGARLFSSPDLADHPELARHAIARRADLNPLAGTARHADDWVVALDDAQVARYATLVDLMVEAAGRRGRGPRALACEVLSTCPFPLARVLTRHGLGRFRVTQKADLRNPADVCRSENAGEADWVMVGTHDTLPIWALVDEWARAGTLPDRAAYLASRLAPEPAARDRLARRLATEPGALAQAQFADLFASPARHVQIFFTDALGFREPYNRPGTVNDANWTLRLAADHAARTAARLERDAALNLPLALAWALRAGGAPTGDRAALAARLDGEAEAWRRRGPTAA